MTVYIFNDQAKITLPTSYSSECYWGDFGPRAKAPWIAKEKRRESKNRKGCLR